MQQRGGSAHLKALLLKAGGLKITVFGLTLSSSWGNGHATPYRALLKALARRGHHITFYERDASYYAAHRDFIACDYCTLCLYDDWRSIRNQALQQAAESDVVINASYCPGGAGIVDDALALPKPLHVFYDLDTPVTLAKLAGGGLDYLRREQVPAFDLYLSFTGGAILHELEGRWGAQRALPLYGCVDPDEHRPMAPQPEFACALSYVGTYAPDRHAKFEELFVRPAQAMPQSTFLLAGSLYPWPWQWPGNVHKLEHVSPCDHAALYGSSRATLNITRASMAAGGYCPSGRFFEAAACGTPVVSDYFLGLETFFALGEEIVVAERAEDVAAVLNRSDEELRRMAVRARERTLAEHTGAARAAQLLDYFSSPSSALGKRKAHAAPTNSPNSEFQASEVAR